MRFGVSMFVTDRTIAPGDLGRLAEDRGFDALFVTEHTHMPVAHSPHPSGPELPDEYKRSLDPFVVLTAVAAVTTRVRLGFGIALLPQRDPITTAKAVASLDLVSGGRVDFGIGAGWNRPEVEHHGTAWDQRFGVMRERVEAMRALWTQEVASYHGRHLAFGDSWAWPKPVQDPLPVWIGGNGPRVLDRVLRYGDHWMPNRLAGLPERVAELRARAEQAGRPRPSVAYFGTPPDPGVVDRLQAAGVDLALLLLPSAAPSDVERAADAAAALAERFA